MAVPALLEDAVAVAGRDRAPRRRITLETSGILPSGRVTEVTVHNISEGGMLIECDAAFDADETLSIDLTDSDTTAARVVWTSGRLYGLEFDRPLSRGMLSAAELRGATDRSLDTGSTGAAEGQPFGMRLQRLRKARGLSLAQLGAMLDVSKPTVWAWEQGRAKPARDRLEALAGALGTTLSVLQAGRDENALAATLAKCRQELADAYGTGVGNVRIMIEL